MEKTNIKKENLEFRTCDERGFDSTEHTTGEVIQHAADGSMCWTIAFWEKTSDGFQLMFVGSRPFDLSVNVVAFWNLIFEGQKYLDANFWK